MTAVAHVTGDYIAIVIPGQAVPYARSGGNGKVRFTPPKQRNAMSHARSCAVDAMGDAPPLEGALHVQIRATYLPPKSWSRKKQGMAEWKTTKADLSNVIKLVEDAFNTIVWRDDAQIAKLEAQKKYGLKCETVVTVMQIPVAP